MHAAAVQSQQMESGVLAAQCLSVSPIKQVQSSDSVVPDPVQTTNVLKVHGGQNVKGRETRSW